MAAQPGDHHMAAHQAMAAAMEREQARQDTHSPLGGQGTSAGITLSEAGPADLASLGMSADVVVPEVGPLQQSPWHPALVVQLPQEAPGRPGEVV